jgi:hypothetical protein
VGHHHLHSTDYGISKAGLAKPRYGNSAVMDAVPVAVQKYGVREPNVGTPLSPRKRFVGGPVLPALP